MLNTAAERGAARFARKQKPDRKLREEKGAWVDKEKRLKLPFTTGGGCGL